MISSTLCNLLNGCQENAYKTTLSLRNSCIMGSSTASYNDIFYRVVIKLFLDIYDQIFLQGKDIIT